MVSNQDVPHHIGKNGPAPCNAAPGNCPLGGEDGMENHFPNYAEADKAFGEMNKDQQFATHSKGSSKNTVIDGQYTGELNNIVSTFIRKSDDAEDRTSNDYDTPREEGEVAGWETAKAVYIELNGYSKEGNSPAYDYANIERFASAMDEEVALETESMSGYIYSDTESQGKIYALEEAKSMVLEAANKARERQHYEENMGRGVQEMTSLSQDIEDNIRDLQEWNASDRSYYSDAQEDGQANAMGLYVNSVEPVVNAFQETGIYNDEAMKSAIETLEKARDKALGTAQDSMERATAEAEAHYLTATIDRLKKSRAVIQSDNPRERRAQDAMESISAISNRVTRMMMAYASDTATGYSEGDAGRYEANSVINDRVLGLRKRFEETGKFPAQEMRKTISELEEVAIHSDAYNRTEQGLAYSEALMNGVRELKAAQRRNLAPNAEEAMNSLSRYASDTRHEAEKIYVSLGDSRLERFENANAFDNSYMESSRRVNAIVDDYQNTGEFNVERINDTIAEMESTVNKAKESLSKPIRNSRDERISQHIVEGTEPHLKKLKEIRVLAQQPRRESSTTPIPLSVDTGSRIREKEEDLRSTEQEAQSIQRDMDAARAEMQEAQGHFILGRDRKVREAQERMDQVSQRMHNFDTSRMRLSDQINREVRRLRVNMNIDGDVTVDDRGNYFINPTR